MAEIEFKRRGTPLWLVLVILLLVGAGAYFAFGRRPDAPAPTPATAPATTAPAVAPAPGTAGIPATPPSSGPSAEFARFVDAGAFPSAAPAQRTYLTEATRKMSDVLRERAPSAGVQILLLRAVADTIAMPETKPERISDLTQLAMFAFAHALTAAKVDDGRLSTAAGAVQPSVPLTRQTRQVNQFLTVTRDLLLHGTGAGSGTAAPTPPSTPPSTPAPRP